MPIREHPKTGSIVICDFSDGFKNPEMAKRRPVMVLSSKIENRHHLCTVVALSTDAPNPVMPYHRQIDLAPLLPNKYENVGVWIKGDMVNAVGFHRLSLVWNGTLPNGRRNYVYDSQSSENVKIAKQCVLRAMGMSILTKHL